MHYLNDKSAHFFLRLCRLDLIRLTPLDSEMHGYEITNKCLQSSSQTSLVKIHTWVPAVTSSLPSMHFRKAVINSFKLHLGYDGIDVQVISSGALLDMFNNSITVRSCLAACQQQE